MSFVYYSPNVSIVGHTVHYQKGGQKKRKKGNQKHIIADKGERGLRASEPHHHDKVVALKKRHRHLSPARGRRQQTL